MLTGFVIMQLLLYTHLVTSAVGADYFSPTEYLKLSCIGMPISQSVTHNIMSIEYENEMLELDRHYPVKQHHYM